ncbi:MAG: hypothetical protein JWN17_2654 [Frankiales bacterium]|nr:hypothetical protein [Frankiales bacterium]
MSSGSPTDGDRTDTSNSGLKVPLIVVAGCAALLLLLIVLAAT